MLLGTPHSGIPRSGQFDGLTKMLERLFAQDTGVKCLASVENFAHTELESHSPEPSLPRSRAAEEIEEDSCNTAIVRIDRDHRRSLL